MSSGISGNVQPGGLPVPFSLPGGALAGRGMLSPQRPGPAGDETLRDSPGKKFRGPMEGGTCRKDVFSFRPSPESGRSECFREGTLRLLCGGVGGLCPAIPDAGPRKRRKVTDVVSRQIAAHIPRGRSGPQAAVPGNRFSSVGRPDAVGRTEKGLRRKEAAISAVYGCACGWQGEERIKKGRARKGAALLGRLRFSYMKKMKVTRAKSGQRIPTDQAM